MPPTNLSRRTLLLGGAATASLAALPGAPAAASVASPPIPPVVRQIVGAVPVDDRYPFIFAIGTDGHLWLNWQQDYDYRRWGDAGTPPGVSLTTGLGVTAVDANHRPYAYALGTDGDVWMFWRVLGGGWQWNSLGAPPPGVATDWARACAVTIGGNSPYLFVGGEDGALWVNAPGGASWAWTSLGAPAGATVRGVSVVGAVEMFGPTKGTSWAQAYVVVDGRLWTVPFSTTGPAWTDIGVPAGAYLNDGNLGAGARLVTEAGVRGHAYAFAMDGSTVWVFAGHSWERADSMPAGIWPANGLLGAVYQRSGHQVLFARASDNTMWTNQRSASEDWVWTGYGPVPFVPGFGQEGAVTTTDTDLDAFQLDDAGNLWRFHLAGTVESWTNLNG
ncbi:hypothetical protein J2S43_003141 [Catenuloplanes nepalensis]|uniref:Uncharacterized protein n=1 Tax=Catenuloplanes nepalensis TaxID=587533 RepID=A0ABT9MTB6_9ACTN|nr:hypothetical protein [Catenuloplanes nepalensis]MDP9794629.1 hypothetical protein [Catenuloplanes nepalensis]